MRSANYCRCPMGLQSDAICSHCGRQTSPDRLHAAMREAGLVVSRSSRGAAWRRSASAFLILLGGLLAIVGHSGDELALQTMGIAVAGCGAVLAAGPGAVRLMAAFANSRTGRVAIGGCIALVLALALVLADNPTLFR